VKFGWCGLVVRRCQFIGGMAAAATPSSRGSGRIIYSLLFCDAFAIQLHSIELVPYLAIEYK